LSQAELDDRLEKSRRQLANLRFKAAARQLKNPNEILWLKRDIARMETVKREMEG
jgi:ribosomal protein L29